MIESKEKIPLINCQKNFWAIIFLISIIICISMSRDITRPFYGLHSWGEAHRAWDARVHINYGLDYTKGLAVRVVGANMPEKPYRYLDHPQLGGLLNVPVMYILGQDEWSLRVANIVLTVLTLLIFAKIVRHLTDDKTAIWASLFFSVFPLFAYFGVNMWFYPIVIGALYNYLLLAGYLNKESEKPIFNKILLALCLFFAQQISWEGFFFALGIGLHYLSQCAFRRRKPDWGLLSILFFAPVVSLMIATLIIIAGRGWDFGSIYQLFTWRAGSGEQTEHNWGLWFAKLWEFMRSNFTLPAILLCAVYIIFGRLISIKKSDKPDVNPKWNGAFPQISLFLIIPLLQIFILKGCLWAHQTWLTPFFMLIAIGAAGGVQLMGLIVDKIKLGAGYYAKGVLILIFLVVSIIGSNNYYSIRHFSETKVDLLKKLNSIIPANENLLSFEDFVVNQHKAKGAFYRPEVAWYLDRDVEIARTLEEIESKAATGKYQVYLMPISDYNPQTTAYLNNLAKQLTQKYKYEYIPAEPIRPLRAPMQPYMIFDLHTKKQ